MLISEANFTVLEYKPGTIVVIKVVHDAGDVTFSDLIDLAAHPLPLDSGGPRRYWHCFIRLTMVLVSTG